MDKKKFHEDAEEMDDRGQHSLFETERLEDYAALALSAMILIIILVLF